MTDHVRSIKGPLTRRQMAKLLACGVPAIGTACAARARGGPDFVPLIRRLTPSIVAIGDGRQTLGSGFAVRPTIIVTAAHVAQAAGSSLTVSAAARQSARVLSLDDDDDLALLEVTEPIRPMPLADSAPQVGEWIVVLGNPFGAGTTATAGIVSAAPGAITANKQLARQLQINASVNPGNSGGPVCNIAGEVVAATTTLIAAGQGIAFATSAATIRTLLAALKK